jgi:histidinol-phosphate/aromatic aminotransferase/cobyric acid decarboxylase-like protein
VESIQNSAANFLLVRFRCSVSCLDEKLRTLLEKENIFVKSCTVKFRGNLALARLAIGTPEENSRLIGGLQKVFRDE